MCILEQMYGIAGIVSALTRPSLATQNLKLSADIITIENWHSEFSVTKTNRLEVLR